jgi:molybdopterin converting factor small subunit
MSIEIFVPPIFQRFTHDVTLIDSSGKTVSQCLDNLVERFPPLKAMLFGEDKSIQEGLNIYLNGENAYPGGMNKLLKDGDKIHIFEVLIGG